MKHRVVSVGGDRSATRLYNLVKQAMLDAGLDPIVSQQVSRDVVQRAHDEGLALTWQTSP